LRQAGFKSVPLGRNLTRAVEKARSLNQDVKIWRSGGKLDPGLPPKLRGTVPYFIDLYQDSEDYRDKAAKTRTGYDRCLEILQDWSARAKHPHVATITRRGLRELHKSLRWPEGEPCGHAEGCPLDRICGAGRNTPCPIQQLPNANAVIRVASILLGVALDEGLVTVNFAKGLKLPSAEGREQVWPDEAIEEFCAKAIAKGRRSIALAVRMGADFGQREADIRKMHRGHRKDNFMRIRPQKVSISPNRCSDTLLGKHRRSRNPRSPAGLVVA
jgi:hypothetical protein